MGTEARDGAASAVQQRQTDTLQLPGGARMPRIGFGTDKVKSADTITAALAAGYRHFDCAAMYGTQSLVGAAIGPWMKQHGREPLFLTSKIWNNAHRPHLARQSAEASLKELGVARLDLLLIHWPVAWTPESTLDCHQSDSQVDLRDTWKALEQMVDDKLVSNIGVSNFSEKGLRELLSFARIKPVVNQLELHPSLSQRRLVGACLRMGMTCTAYSPLGNRKGGILEAPAVMQLADTLGKTPAQVVLRWNVQRGIAVIPSSSSAEHIRDNIEGLFEWTLTQEQKAQLDALDKGSRLADVDWHDWNI